MSTDPYAPPPEPRYGEPAYGEAAYVDPNSGGQPLHRPAPDPSETANKKLAAGITGILLGSFGVHKFILGYTNAGAIMLAITLATLVGGIPTCGITWPLTGAMSVIGLVEGIIYLTKTDDDFYRTYLLGKKEWF